MLSAKIGKRFRFGKIRHRFLAAMIALSIPSIMLVGYISFNVANNALMDLNEKTNRERLRTSSDMADLLLRSINNLHYSIVVNEAIREQLSRGSDPMIQPDSGGVRLSTRLQRLISATYSDTRYVKSICLLDLQLNAYCSGRSDDAGVYEGPGKMGRMVSADWYRSAYASKGKVVYYPKDLFGETDEAFSTVKLFRHSGDTEGQPIGILIVNVSKAIFGQVFGTADDYGSYMVIDDSHGSVQAVYGESATAAAADGSGSVQEAIGRLQNEGYLINPVYNQTTGWTFLHLVRAKELLKQSQNIGWATMAIAAGFAVIALALSYLISGTVTRPLLRLKKMMLDWTMGIKDLGGSFDKDEVGVIAETFRRVACENDELNAKLMKSKLKEREAELRALQSQIKPHFLYNTLDSIYWMAVLHRSEPIAQMAESLSESFKLSLNKGRETIPVYNELKHIEHYLRIQNIRFHHRFRYVEQVEESILAMDILKLLLQPLVENAIYHGLEPKLGSGTIRLTGARDGSYLIFTVEDDGVGMDDLARTEQGYGLRNVRERLKLYYGEDSSLKVRSRPGEGTSVTLRFKPYPHLENAAATTR